MQIHFSRVYTELVMSVISLVTSFECSSYTCRALNTDRTCPLPRILMLVRMGNRHIYLHCKRICFSETVREMRPDLDDVQYLLSKADKEKLRCLDAVTNLATLILASPFVSISPCQEKSFPA